MGNGNETSLQSGAVETFTSAPTFGDSSSKGKRNEDPRSLKRSDVFQQQEVLSTDMQPPLTFRGTTLVISDPDLTLPIHF